MNCEEAMEEGEVKKTEVLEDLSVDLRITLKLRIRFSGM
jgi:hypothetical protein